MFRGGGGFVRKTPCHASFWGILLVEQSQVTQKYIAAKFCFVTKFMEQNPWDADSSSASQEIPCILLNL